MRQIGEIKTQLEQLHAERDRLDEKIFELEREARVAIAELHAVLGVPQSMPVSALPPLDPNRPPAAPKQHNPWDETDAGMGIGGRSELGNMSREEFTDELAYLRAHGAAKRKRA